MFKKILIANRGEIACRIIKTAKRFNIQTVLVTSEIDKTSLAATLADEVVCLGGNSAKDNYLQAEAILAVAKTHHVEAIHPGYGFLSENAEFAKACEQAQICFIGPPAQAIHQMGSKAHAKNIMQAAHIPTLLGYQGEAQDLDTLKKAAKKIGYPVLLKASAGGGGKGMRIVEEDSAFESAYTSTKREALSSFNDDTLIIEKYLSCPRHIEIQIFTDKQGQGIYLFERDCSIQRRHQKVLEEAPAPHFPDALRQAMGETAVKAALAIQYVGAGTIEFLLDKDNHYYFMEMNTRLQVEHPVTEMITGLDLIEWQLRIAYGEPLPLTQKELVLKGHAIEARIYAEDPDNDFLPAIGKLYHLQAPTENKHVRVDTGVRAGDSISPYYDPMIAKLIVWGADRKTALSDLIHALNNYHIIGLKTNIDFLKRIATHARYQGGHFSTHFIAEEEKILHTPAPLNFPLFFAALASYELSLLPEQTHTPWEGGAWQSNLPSKLFFAYEHQEEKLLFSIIKMPEQDYRLQTGNKHFHPIKIDNTVCTFSFDQKKYQANIVQTPLGITVFLENQMLTVKRLSERIISPTTRHQKDFITPMPGTVIAIYHQVGDTVKAGSDIITIEAMKMEHTLKAPKDLTITALHCELGEMVTLGKNLLDFD
jgi:3-methylcrotonyl-CoA carboxylase alpha subunit